MGRLIKPSKISVSMESPARSTESLTTPQGDVALPQPETKVVEEGDTYLERVAKYVPAEVVAFYFFANSILKQSAQDASKVAQKEVEAAKLAGNTISPETPRIASLPVELVGLFVFFLAWACVYFYIRRIGQPDEAVGTNALVSMMMFPVWAYAVGGVGLDKLLPYDGHFASILLGAATLISGLVAPAEKTQG